MAKNLLKKDPPRPSPGPARWDLPHLHAHLQYAVDLEMWTIPFYMSALYSIRDRACEAYQLIQSVVHQEMLHVELASNVANAFGLSPAFGAPVYEGRHIPHLDFRLDEPNPTHEFSPYSAEIGPLDEERINAMCLIEYPEWLTGGSPDPRDDVRDYGSIGEFYAAIRIGVRELAGHIRGGHHQVDLFQGFYNHFADQVVTRDGLGGLPQVLGLIEAITEQGEGQTEATTLVQREFRNTADDPEPEDNHYQKFQEIRSRRLPETYRGAAHPPAGSPGHQAQEILAANFALLRRTLESLFGGGRPADFGAVMATIGGNVLNCWKNGAIPRFS